MKIRLSDLRTHSREKADKKTFINLNGAQLGVNIHDDNDLSFYIFKDDKVIMESKKIHKYAGVLELQHTLEETVLTFYQKYRDKNELPMFTKIELAILCSHLQFHIDANTLSRVINERKED